MTSLSLLESRDDPAENCGELAKWKTRTLRDLRWKGWSMELFN